MTDDKLGQLLEWTLRQLKELSPEAVFEALLTNPAFINLTDDEREDFRKLFPLKAAYCKEQTEAYAASAAAYRSFLQG